MAEDVAFPNGMAVTPDNRTLIVAESYGNRLTARRPARWRGCSRGRPMRLMDAGVDARDGISSLEHPDAV